MVGGAAAAARALAAAVVRLPARSQRAVAAAAGHGCGRGWAAGDALRGGANYSSGAFVSLNRRTSGGSMAAGGGGGGVVGVHSAQEWAQHMSGTGSFGGTSTAIVDFTASWCGPCQMVAPHFEQLSRQYPMVLFLKVDVDELQDIARELGVRAMPTFMSFVNGEKTDEIVGADLGKLKAVVQQLAQQSGSSVGKGQKVGGGGASDGAADDAEERRARLAAAAEARMKTMAN